jgi:hypothetical protein
MYSVASLVRDAGYTLFPADAENRACDSLVITTAVFKATRPLDWFFFFAATPRGLMTLSRGNLRDAPFEDKRDIRMKEKHRLINDIICRNYFAYHPRNNTRNIVLRWKLQLVITYVHASNNLALSQPDAIILQAPQRRNIYNQAAAYNELCQIKASLTLSTSLAIFD